MILNFKVGDRVELKKDHPCGCRHFIIKFAGSDVKFSCCGCGREMILPRIKLEKSIKRIIPGESND